MNTAISVTDEAPSDTNRKPTVLPGHLQSAFRVEEIAGLKLATNARLVAVAIIAVWLLVDAPAPALYYFEAVGAAAALSGLAHYRLVALGIGGRWISYAFVSFDMALIAYALTALPAGLIGIWPPQMMLRESNTEYFLILLALVALGYAPRLMLWGGLAAAVAWLVAVAWVMRQPGTASYYPEDIFGPRHLALALDPGFIDINAQVQTVIILMIVAGILSAVVWRSRRLVMREATIARERANLARYFSPNMVDELAGRDQPLGPGRRQDVAVLFADLVGFTTRSEAMSPEDVLALLREFHGRMEAEVFGHGGTMEKFIGDALLATFGVPRPGAALACAHAMLASAEEWRRERETRGAPSIEVGIGVHFGPAVLGDIGSERNMAFAVVGDTTNTASRLEGLTRDYGCHIVISEDLVGRVRDDSPTEADSLLSGFRRRDPVQLRGRSEPIAVWTKGDTED
jgi:adenylate cyclase